MQDEALVKLQPSSALLNIAMPLALQHDLSAFDKAEPAAS